MDDLRGVEEEMASSCLRQISLLYECRKNCKEIQSSINLTYGNTFRQKMLLGRRFDKKIIYFIGQISSSSL